MYTNYNPYSGSTLTHYGVKGMKWGVRRERDGSGAGRVPRTAWGKKRQEGRNYAKQQDARDKELWNKTKSDWKQAKKTTERGSDARNAARRKYREERDRHNEYWNTRYIYGYQMGMSKAARGRQMLKNHISADQPVSDLSVGTQLKNDGIAFAKQVGTYTLASVGVGALAGVAANALNSRR